MATGPDWRLTNQERYLKGVDLFLRRYVPASPHNDHDHCEFCGAKFMTGDVPGALNRGYTTADGHRWICPDCFEDFRELFQWRIPASKPNG